MMEVDQPAVDHLLADDSSPSDQLGEVSAKEHPANDIDYAAIVQIKTKRVSKIPTKIRNVIKANQLAVATPEEEVVDPVINLQNPSHHNNNTIVEHVAPSSSSPSLRGVSKPMSISPPEEAVVRRSVSKNEAPPRPVIPIFDASQTLYPLAFNQIQSFIDAFHYNYTGIMFYKLRKTGGSRHILDVFRQITTFALPIQCVEAVFIGSVLTAPWKHVDRIPISFKSKFKNSVHRHIILAVHENGKWGALGISRRSCLMYKAVEYDTLWDLVQDYKLSYQSVYHKLLSVYCGNPMPHNFEVDKPIVWKAIKLRTELDVSEANKEQLADFLRKNLKQSR